MKTLERTATHKVATRDEWLKARKALLAKEKEHTHQRDALTRERMALPWVRVDKDYVFDAPGGTRTLADLFDGRTQLLVYHLMFGPTWEAACPNCAYVMDHVDGALPHLNHRDVSFVAISRAPLARIETFKKRMGWKFDWVSAANTDFNFDYHVSFTCEQIESGQVEYNFEKLDAIPEEEAPGYSVFAKDAAGNVFHTYSTYARGLDALVGTYQFLDLVPKGRDEEGLKHAMAWVRYHDQYDKNYRVDPNADYAAPKGARCCDRPGANR
jgi:predicted dithiol-disulfide oxidoreductase (DUF899 family)